MESSLFLSDVLTGRGPDTSGRAGAPPPAAEAVLRKFPQIRSVHGEVVRMVGAQRSARPTFRIMDRRMRSLLPAALGIILGVAIDASAHRLDECLQATRIAVATNRIDLSIDLTPGVAVADRLWAIIDEDRDGELSAEEQAAYVRRVWKETHIGLDGMRLSLHETEASFPGLDEFRSGHGVIRIRASADIRPLVAGSHQLTLTNAHLPSLSVYLVNALVPTDGAVKIASQTRDELQKGYRLNFAVTSRAPRAPER